MGCFTYFTPAAHRARKQARHLKKTTSSETPTYNNEKPSLDGSLPAYTPPPLTPLYISLSASTLTPLTCAQYLSTFPPAPSAPAVTHISVHSTALLTQFQNLPQGIWGSVKTEAKKRELLRKMQETNGCRRVVEWEEFRGVCERERKEVEGGVVGAGERVWVVVLDNGMCSAVGGGGVLTGVDLYADPLEGSDAASCNSV